ncbi:MAG: hypothetical protein WCK32_00035 [Chlorobiaceae bacterium]
MKKLLLSVALLFLFVPTAFAEHWVQVSSGESSSAYVDTESIEYQGSDVAYNTPQKQDGVVSL